MITIILSATVIGSFIFGLIPIVLFTSSMDCRTCMYSIDLLNTKFNVDVPPKFIFELAKKSCKAFKLKPEDECDGIFNTAIKQASYILEKEHDQNPAGYAFDICTTARRMTDFTWEYTGMYEGFLVGEKCADSNDTNGFNTWEVKIPEYPSKPPIIPQSDPPSNVSRYKVLHLTDVHMMLDYIVGSKVDCGADYCCYNGTVMADLEEESAGYWGSYKCSIPFRLFEALLDQIVKNHPENFDWIIYTGDSPGSNYWAYSRTDVFEMEEKVLNTITTKFPNIPVYVSLGNHDYLPINFLPTHDEKHTVLSGKWLYDNLVNLEWAQRSLDQKSRSQWADQGFFSKSINKNLRVISLNNNFCLAENGVTLLHKSDPGDHLHWLMTELLESERRGEKVHLISHQPPMDCYPRWRKEWTKVMIRFESTVTSIFLGHQHVDYFQIWHNENGNPSILAFIGPSVTIQDKRNPEFKVYHIASDINFPMSFGKVINHETWTSDFFNQSRTKNDYPSWYKLYDGHDLGVAGTVSADAYKQVLRRAMTDDLLYKKLVLYYNQGVDKQLPNDRRKFLCNFIYNIKCDL